MPERPLVLAMLEAPTPGKSRWPRCPFRRLETSAQTFRAFRARRFFTVALPRLRPPGGGHLIELRRRLCDLLEARVEAGFVVVALKGASGLAKRSACSLVEDELATGFLQCIERGKVGDLADQRLILRT